MSIHEARRAYATSLLADLKASSVVVPRRETLVDWLGKFLSRATEVSPGESRQANLDLIAINDHLLACAVPARGERTALPRT